MLINIEKVDFKSHALFTEVAAMQELVKPLHQYTIDNFSYQRIDADGGIVNLSSHPEIEEIFIKQKFYQKTFGATYHQYISGFYLGDFLGLDSDFFKALEDQGLLHMLIWVCCHDDHTEIFSFASSVRAADINHFYLSHLNIFEKFSLSFKDKAARLFRNYQSQRLIYPLGADHSVLTDQVLALKFALHQEFGNDHNLTQRECECLHYLQQGYTAKMIAQKINISYRTVEHHLAHIREKFSVSSTRQLMLRPSCVN